MRSCRECQGGDADEQRCLRGNMCGRFTLGTSSAQLVDVFDLIRNEELVRWYNNRAHPAGRRHPW